MTYIQAIAEARKFVGQYHGYVIIFYRKPHWWSRKKYGFTITRDFVNKPHYGITLVATMCPDGKLR